MRGVLLNKRGRPEQAPELLGPSGLPVRVEENLGKGWAMPSYDEQPDARIAVQFDRLPQHILDMLERSGRADFSKSSGFMNSQGWRSAEGVIAADTASAANANEQNMAPDFNLSVPRPGQSMIKVVYKYTLFGDLSMAITTPGTLTRRMRWGTGIAGPILAASTALAPTGTQVITTQSFCLEYWVTIRTDGATGTAWCQGRWHCPGTLETTPASTTILVTHLKDMMVPANAPAVSPSIDLTVAKTLSPTVQSSVTTAAWATHLAIVESLN